MKRTFCDICGDEIHEKVQTSVFDAEDYYALTKIDQVYDICTSCGKRIAGIDITQLVVDAIFCKFEKEKNHEKEESKKLTGLQWKDAEREQPKDGEKVLIYLVGTEKTVRMVTFSKKENAFCTGTFYWKAGYWASFDFPEGEES